MTRIEAVATRDDVANLYRLVLRREPENEGAIEPNLGQPLAGIIKGFYTSAEFEALARHPLEGGSFTWLALERPASDHYADILQSLGLSPETSVAIHASANYFDFHYRLLKACVEAELFDYDLTWLERAEGGRGLPRGEIWGSDGQSVSGWVAPSSIKDGPTLVEVWHEGQRISSGLADRFDNRCAAMGPEYANTSFWIVLPLSDQDRVLEIEVREALNGRLVGRLSVNQARFDRALLGDFEQKLEQISSQVGQLRSELPRLSYQTAIPLENYGQFYDRWLKRPFDEPLYTDLEALVIVQTEGADAIAVEAMVQSVLVQSHPRLRLALQCSPQTLVIFSDLARRVSLELGSEVTVFLTDQWPSLDASDLVVILSGQSLAHPDLAAAAAAYFALFAHEDGLYFDEDGLAPPSSATLDYQHIEPQFKPDFDLDLLLQTPYVGSCIAVRGRAWEGLSGAGLLPAEQAPSAIALRLDEAGYGIGHWPIVMTSSLSTAQTGLDAASWRAEVQAHLEARGWEARVEEARDILGASTLGRSRVVWPVPAGTKASVIIPTRDSLDLLKPCVESLFSHSQHNQTEMEVIIVDHESRDPLVLDYLHELAEGGRARILPHQGPFNWALKNNLAAEVATGEVLIFLNNDTLVCSPSWLDELVAQALRPGVGAVGCRLIYPDKSLQHGGFVAAPRFEGFLGHEGLFQPGHDGGYLGRHTVVRQTTAVTGACVAIKASRFADLGGFEAAAFPVDGNDVDYCFRARDSGYRILYTPYATLYHLESKSRGMGSDEGHKAFLSASLRLWKKWGSKYGQDPFYNPNFDRTMVPFSRLSPSGRLL